MKTSARKIKEKFFHPSPVFGQLIALVNQANVEAVIRKTKADKHSKKFKTKHQLYTMLVAVICQIKSLRDLCALFQVNIEKLNQMGLSVPPNRSTLSYVNKHRNHQIFEDIYKHLCNYYQKFILDSSDALIIKGLKQKVFSHLVNFVGLHVISYINLERYWQYRIDELMKMIRSVWERDPTKWKQLSLMFEGKV